MTRPPHHPPPRTPHPLRLNSLLLCRALVTGAGGCASTATAGPQAAEPSHRSDLVTADELVGRSFANAYDAIQQLRPSMLIQYGNAFGSHAPTIQVYMDNAGMGGLAAQRDIPAASIKEIRSLSPTDATQRFGTAAAGGAIVITTH